MKSLICALLDEYSIILFADAEYGSAPACLTLSGCALQWARPNPSTCYVSLAFKYLYVQKKKDHKEVAGDAEHHKRNTIQRRGKVFVCPAGLACKLLICTVKISKGAG